MVWCSSVVWRATASSSKKWRLAGDLYHARVSIETFLEGLFAWFRKENAELRVGERRGKAHKGPPLPFHDRKKGGSNVLLRFVSLPDVDGRLPTYSAVPFSSDCVISSADDGDDDMIKKTRVAADSPRLSSQERSAVVMAVENVVARLSAGARNGRERPFIDAVHA